MAKNILCVHTYLNSVWIEIYGKCSPASSMLYTFMNHVYIGECVCGGGGGRPFCVSLLHLVALAGFTFSAFVSISQSMGFITAGCQNAAAFCSFV